MIHKILTLIDPALIGSIMGTILLVPFAYFTYDVKKHPKNYQEH
tara:strand:+ start:258 stop:389 length:132 start_codon:yes stop_codon:yes gene_type:complete